MKKPKVNRNWIEILMINRDEEEHDEENETHRQMYQLFSPILFSTTLLSIEYICAHRCER